GIGRPRGIDDLRRVRGVCPTYPAQSCLAPFLLQDVVTDVDALVADMNARAGDELCHLMLGLVAKGPHQGAGAPPQGGRHAVDPAFDGHGILPVVRSSLTVKTA